MLPMRTAPAVCELEGPTIIGPRISKISAIAVYPFGVCSALLIIQPNMTKIHSAKERLSFPALQKISIIDLPDNADFPAVLLGAIPSPEPNLFIGEEVFFVLPCQRQQCYYVLCLY